MFSLGRCDIELLLEATNSVGQRALTVFRRRCTRINHKVFAANLKPWRRRSTRRSLPPFGHGDQAFALGLFPGGLARAPDGFRLLAGLALGRFFIRLAALHLTKNALALQLLFEHPQSLIDIVVANDDLQSVSNRGGGAGGAVKQLMLSRQRVLRFSADCLPRLLTSSYSTT